MATPTGPITAEHLLFIPEEQERCDLIRGELVWTPFMWTSECMAKDAILFALLDHVQRRDRWEVLPSVGFVLERNPDTVLGPDVSFTPAERLPPRDWEGYIEGPPDLAVEVICHADTACYVTDKIVIYLAAGTRLLWLPDPARQTVLEYRADGRFHVLRPDDVLDGGEVVPGFRLPVAALFR